MIIPTNRYIHIPDVILRKSNAASRISFCYKVRHNNGYTNINCDISEINNLSKMYSKGVFLSLFFSHYLCVIDILELKVPAVSPPSYIYKTIVSLTDRFAL